MSNKEREFDLLLWGCTGVTGKLVATLIARRYGVSNPGLKVVLGGRSQTRLKDVAELMLNEALQSLNPEVRERAKEIQKQYDTNPETTIIEPIITISDFGCNKEETNKKTIDMCKRSRVVLALAGPFEKFGEPIVKGCAETGTDYVDITGECAWVKEMYNQYDSTAKANKARIIPATGFGSLLNDVGLTALQREARTQTNTSTSIHEVEQYPLSTGFAPSGGTLRTILERYKKQSLVEILFGTQTSVYEMCDKPPVFLITEKANQEHSCLWFSKLSQSWIAPMFLGGVMVRFLHWGDELKNHPYGQDLVIHVGEKCQGFIMGLFKSALTSLITGVATILSRFDICAKRLIASPGQGKTMEELEEPGNYVQMTSIGIVVPPKGPSQKITHTITYRQGEAYIMSAEGVLASALSCLVKRRESVDQGPFGIGTATYLLGDTIENQLRKAGFEMKTTAIPIEKDEK